MVAVVIHVHMTVAPSNPLALSTLTLATRTPIATSGFTRSAMHAGRPNERRGGIHSTCVGCMAALHDHLAVL